MNEKLLKLAKEKTFDIHVYEGEYSHHETEYTFSESGIVALLELVQANSASDAEANLKIAREALEAILIGQITKDYNLLLSTVGMAIIAKQALEKIGDEVKLTKQEVSILHKAHKKSVTVICDECSGTVQVVYSGSGGEIDGNALVYEPCHECGNKD